MKHKNYTRGKSDSFRYKLGSKRNIKLKRNVVKTVNEFRPSDVRREKSEHSRDIPRKMMPKWLRTRGVRNANDALHNGFLSNFSDSKIASNRERYFDIIYIILATLIVEINASKAEVVEPIWGVQVVGPCRWWGNPIRYIASARATSSLPTRPIELEQLGWLFHSIGYLPRLAPHGEERKSTKSEKDIDKSRASSSLPDDGSSQMLRRSSRILKRPETSAGTTQENEGRRKKRVDGTDEIRPVRRSSRVAERTAAIRPDEPKPLPEPEPQKPAPRSRRAGYNSGKKGIASRVATEVDRREHAEKAHSRYRSLLKEILWQTTDLRERSKEAVSWGKEIAEEGDEAQDLYLAPVPGAVPEIENSMESSGTSASRGDNQSTIKGSRVQSNKLDEAKLRYRRVSRKASEDKKLDQLSTKLTTQLPEQTIGAVPGLLSLLRSLADDAEENADEICYPFMDDLSFKIDERKADIGFPVINKQYFEKNLKRCLSTNEAVLQRTIMMTVFDQFWLGKIFDWNTEGQWSQPKDTRVPSREDDDLSLPKPDLAISFTRTSLTGDVDDSDPIPKDLEKCISPDGGDRCFPFLFMEVKKAAADLQAAFLPNLNNASQALYNMYLWMARAGHSDNFFNKIRVFSLVFNAQDLSVRLHRAERLADDSIAFRFAEYRPLDRYDRDQACVLVSSILKNYAAEELHSTLKAAYDEVIRQEDARVVSKRKANAARNTDAKRSRTSGDIDPNTSLGMSALTT
ncbi:MAG: hypothetical protein Q9165_001277 [Trypethelium subeluteriae]